MFKDLSNPIIDAIRVVFTSSAPHQHERIYEDLQRAYGEPQRHYHTLRHITEMLELAKNFPLQDKKAFIAAVLYHDYVYEAQRYAPDYVGLSNEQQSALACEKIMLAHGCDNDTIYRAKELILMTETHKAPEDDDEARLFMDIDMSIIGKPQRRYSEYAGCNAREYLSVFTPEQYIMGRTAFLTHAKDKSPIFKTAHFADYEEQAHENILWGLKNLPTLVMTAAMTNNITARKNDYQ